jgi:hypothetical protein
LSASFHVTFTYQLTHEYQQEDVTGNQLLEFLLKKVIFTHKRTSEGCGEA